MRLSTLTGRSLSLEVFTPRGTAGVEDLLADGGRLAAYTALGPAFVTVSGPPAGSLQISEWLRSSHCLKAQLQLVATEFTADSVHSLLSEAVQLGIHDVLVTGSPPNTPPPASGSGKFASATELVSFVKERMGDAMRVAVCGYPRGSRGERGEYAADLAEVGRQVLAGAERVVCLPCFDAETHWSFVADARAARISCPIAPGLLPIYSAAEFRHVCRALAVDPPAWLEAKLRAAAGTK